MKGFMELLATVAFLYVFCLHLPLFIISKLPGGAGYAKWTEGFFYSSLVWIRDLPVRFLRWSWRKSPSAVMTAVFFFVILCLLELASVTR